MMFFEQGPRFLIRIASRMLPIARQFGIRRLLRVLPEVRRFDVETRRARHLALKVFPFLAEQAGPL